ncbi:YjcG family protein [Metabacillus sp. 84]|uniref:YjcG family protein n=1 Tax=unclassified Metabacillus TaxID=2675274 RepID=UPI003CE86FC6
MKYGIVLFPAKKLQDLANSYRKRYDPHYALIPPHLTLRTPFEASDENIKEISKELRAIAKKFSPVQLEVQKISSFSPVNNVIYLKAEPNDNLIALHNELYTGALEEEPEYSFVPHITIGQKLSDAEMADVLGQLKMQENHHIEMIDRFHLLYQLENGAWTVYETFILEKGDL